MSNMPQMLEGYRVLDFSQFVAGPTCSRILAEMGAEVIKVEMALEGDRTRSAGLKPLEGKHKSTTHSTYYLQHNHSKLSIALDLTKAAARELVLAMVPKVDVVPENFAPGVMKRMGFSYEDLNRVNPKIAHAKRDGVRDAYNRAEYLAERERMMQRWADHLDALAALGVISPANTSSSA